MKIFEAPKPPGSLTKNRRGQAKWKELCATLLQKDQLTTGSLHAIEIAAQNYSRWQSFEKMAGDDPESKALTQAQRHCRLYLAAIKELGLSKSEKAKPGAAPQRPKALNAKPAKRRTDLRILKIEKAKKGRTG